MNKIFLFFKKTEKTIVIFSKRRAKKIFCAKEALRYVLLHLFSKRCSKKIFCECSNSQFVCAFFGKGAPKNVKGEELSTVPLPFNSLSFKRLKDSP